MSYTYDGISGQTGVTGGTIQSPSLVIPSPTSDMTGIYTCIGTNSEGSMESDPVSFNVFGGKIIKPCKIKILSHQDCVKYYWKATITTTIRDTVVTLLSVNNDMYQNIQ